ncbi:MAG: response regulator [Candidatus Methanomarinus sp.]|uniref:Response regulator n=1 Tax=Candidatus Methanomarinus sp. TaxID=3386244 RepID=A0AC61SBI5_9EURY|nr:MinD superfamily P-loop ATPase [ANME-2 cluster archaeon]TKY92082.1 MAG: response regulator [ANME-2 cluster archaeon]
MIMKKARILIVEDEAIVAEDLENLIIDFGYEMVGSVVGADDAIQQAIEHRPDLILMDIMLKGNKNGIDAANEIKDMLKIPIIFLTAYSDLKLIEEAKNTEPYAFIVKPFQDKQVIASIEMALSRSQIEKKLFQSEEIYHTLIDNIQDGLFLIQDGKLKFVNEAFSRIPGYTVDEVLGMDFKDFVAPEDKDMVVDRYARMMKGEKVLSNYEFHGIRKNETKRTTIYLVCSPITYQGKPAVLGTVKDITKRKQLEEQMQLINEELEERIIERTTELKQTYKQLYHAQKMESVGILAGGIAHDFNNLLTVILGNILLAKKDVDPEDRVFNVLLEAEDASLRAKDLTQELLTFSKGGEPIKRTISISKLIKDTVNFTIRGTNVTCKFEIPDNLYNIDGDDVQITQVISNIIINADQAMLKGGTIRVRCENVTISSENENTTLPENKNFIRISIEDHGTGMPKEQISLIFDPFFTTKEKGSGLGLATAYSIIKKHGGQITVESEVGTGSTFYIYLPAAQKKVSPKADMDVIEKPSEGSGERILVMDDDENIRFLLSEILTSYGYMTESACDGAQAIELYKKAYESSNQFDLVILDLTIPAGIGGKETIKELIKIDPDVKGIVSSGYSNDAIMANYRQYGFSGVISKPYRPDDLVRIVQDVLNSSK